MAGKLKHDITGLKSGELTAVEYLGKSQWRCECSCGKEQVATSYVIMNGLQTSCGCKSTKSVLIDLTNKQFGEWTALSYAGNHKWLCECSCGKQHEINSIILRNGESQSCGHAREDQISATLGKKFGEWKVLSHASGGRWLCECSCGTQRELGGYALRQGTTKSCGHSTTGLKDLTGEQFGEWRVLSRALEESNTSSTPWLCECSCGTQKVISSYALRTEGSKSCGCKRNELRTKTCQDLYGVDHPAQANTERTENQLDMIRDKDKLKRLIEEEFNGRKPKVEELGHVLGISRGSARVHVAKYKLEDFVTYGVQESIYEEELAKLFTTETRRIRGIAGTKEIDLYYEESKIGLEFNGNYWHSELKKEKNYHQNKTKAASVNKVDIIHIFEYEWLDSSLKQKLIKLISNRLNPNSRTKVYARDCEIKEITDIAAKEFLDTHHLQGSTQSSVRLGLFNKDNLLGVMTFGKTRFNENYQYELIRIAWHSDYDIIDGAEKLFEQFITVYKPNNIISYCDISKSNGAVYFQLKFKILDVSSPNYKWVNWKSNVINSYEIQKYLLGQTGYDFKDQTEEQIMQGLGFLRIYDCGNARFSWEK